MSLSLQLSAAEFGTTFSLANASLVLSLKSSQAKKLRHWTIQNGTQARQSQNYGRQGNDVKIFWFQFFVILDFYKVDSHGTKLEELENLVKDQALLIDELKSKQEELTIALDSKQEQLEAAIAESKGQAAKELSDVKVALEQSQETTKVELTSTMESRHVQLEASIADSRELASKEISDVKIALEQSHETATKKLAEQLDRVETRANFFFEIYQRTKLATTEFLENCPDPYVLKWNIFVDVAWLQEISFRFCFTSYLTNFQFFNQN